jgi:hypothetical protein
MNNLMYSMKSYVVDRIRDWYAIPDEKGDPPEAAIVDRVKYLLFKHRYIFENLEVHPFNLIEMSWSHRDLIHILMSPHVLRNRVNTE